MEKSCKQCNATFDITDDDIAFYDAVSPVFNGKKISLPPPDQCPDCRYQQRLTWRNERNLYRRKCAVTGEDIVSIFSPDKSWPPIVKQSYWWSDAWDPREYGRDFDFNRPFFEQWLELFKVVPQLAMNNQQSENCEFSNQSQMNKDCYMVFCTSESRDCMHGMWFQFCENCVDCLYLGRSRYCYEVVNGENCYHCTHSQNLTNCSEVHYSRDCIGCQDCFGCVNLRRKEYCIFNEQKTKEEYETFMKSFDSTSWSAREVFRNRMEEMAFQHPRPHAILRHTEDVSGNFLQQAKNVRERMFIQYAEDCLRCFNVHEGVRDCRDYTLFGRRAELIYESASCGIDIQRLAFCYQCREGSNSLYYCSSCDACQDCFGSISLRHKRYCIFNRQYTKDEYEQTVPKLIEKMRREGAWGEMFPMDLSPIPYNHSYAQRYFPLTKRQALERGLGWYDKEVEDAKQAVNAGALPDQLPSASEPILARSVSSGRPYRITTKEMEKYHQLGVPLPRYTYDERMELRAKKLGGIRLYERTCMKTGKPILTTYAPDSPYIIWDRDIYEEESVS